MRYYIQRGVNEYGPYTLADLQRYVAQGNILMGDLTRSEGMSDWVPVAQVLGNIPVPVPAPAPAGGTVYGQPGAYGTGVAPAAMPTPVPPDFHWALVLLFSVLTCTLFWTVWVIVEAAWIRKIKPASRGLLYVCLALAISVAGGVFNGITGVINHGQSSPFGLLFFLTALVLQIIGVFTLRSDLEDYYNTTENINLRMNGVGSALLTLFFAPFYFQWHFSRIARWKKTGILEPQG
jgi:GYF domain 2